MRKKDRRLLLELEEKRTAEKDNPSELGVLERGFYRNVASKIGTMRVEVYDLFERKQLSEATRLNMEIEKVENTLNELIQLRLRKILMFSVWEKREIKNMTPEEMELYSDIRHAIERFKNIVFGRENEPEPPASAMPVNITADSSDSNLSVPETGGDSAEVVLDVVESEESAPVETHVETGVGADENSEAEKPSAGVTVRDEPEKEKRVLVRVKSPVGRFALPGGKVLTLRKEDVLFVPEKVYRILVRWDKVEALNLDE